MRRSIWWKITKWTFGIVGTLCLLITVCLYLFRDEICSYVIREVNKNLNAEVRVSKVGLAFWGSFPNLSVDFHNVYIADPLDKSPVPDTLLYTERLRLKFNPLDVWNEKYDVQELDISPGTLKLRIDSAGNENYDILKASEDSTSSRFTLKLENVVAENLHVAYNNDATQQFYSTDVRDIRLSGAFSEEDFTMRARSDLRVASAKSGQVTLLTDKNVKLDLAIAVRGSQQQFELKDTRVLVENLPFRIKGIIDSSDIHFTVRSENLQLQDVANNFALAEMEHVRQFSGSGTVHFNADIRGKNVKNSPLEVACSFGIRNGNLIEPTRKLKLRNISVNGNYSSVGGKQKEFLKLSDIRFNTVGGPFEGKLLITDFSAPLFDGSAKGSVDLGVLHTLFRLPYIDSVSGNVQVNSDFLIRKLAGNDARYDVRKCEGSLELKGIEARLTGDKRVYRDLSGQVYLRNDEAGMEDIRMKIGSSDLHVNGLFRQLKGYLAQKNELRVSMSLDSRRINLQDLASTTKAQKIEDGRSYILPQNVQGNLELRVNDLIYENHHFEKISSNMHIGNRCLSFPELALSNAGAQVNASLIIEERSPEVFLISTSARSANIDFKALFKEWNDFDQQVISRDNISGKASADLIFEAPFDMRNGIIHSGIRSQIHLKVTDGRLQHVKAFEEIVGSIKSSSARLVLKKHNIDHFGNKLSDLRFETLENTILIRNSRIEIPAMTIRSSALDVSLNGTHTFANDIDYHFDFRFRDLKQHKDEREFGQVQDDGTGVRIFIRMYGNLDAPRIQWDTESQKEQVRENREEAKQEAKSILKDEFGLFRKDTTVREYQPKDAPDEELILQFGKKEHEAMQESEKQEKQEKETPVNNILNKWKKQKEAEEQEEFELFK